MHNSFKIMHIVSGLICRQYSIENNLFSSSLPSNFALMAFNHLFLVRVFSFKHCVQWCNPIPKFFRYLIYLFSHSLSTWLLVICYLLMPIWSFRSQPVLQELGKQNPSLLRLIDEHHAEFLQLINEPVEGSEGWVYCLPYVVYMTIYHFIFGFYKHYLIP